MFLFFKPRAHLHDNIIDRDAISAKRCKARSNIQNIQELQRCLARYLYFDKDRNVGAVISKPEKAFDL